MTRRGLRTIFLTVSHGNTGRALSCIKGTEILGKPFWSAHRIRYQVEYDPASGLFTFGEPSSFDSLVDDPIQVVIPKSPVPIHIVFMEEEEILVESIMMDSEMEPCQMIISDVNWRSVGRLCRHTSISLKHANWALLFSLDFNVKPVLSVERIYLWPGVDLKEVADRLKLEVKTYKEM